MTDKLLNFQKTTFLKSAALLSQSPHDTGAEVAFVGRSNAGKSSALNALTNQKSLARTSRTPGRTQLLNYFDLGDDMRLVDLPGYGFAKVSRHQKNAWEKTINNYLYNRKSLKGLVLLMDIRHPLKDIDVEMIDWAAKSNIPIHILLTKADKPTQKEKNQSLKKVQNFISDYFNIEVQLFSATKKLGLPQLRSRLSEWLIKEN